MGKDRAAGRVGSDFLSAIAGRVRLTFRRVGSGPRKVTRGQLWFNIYRSILIQRPCMYCGLLVGLKSVCVHSDQWLWSGNEFLQHDRHIPILCRPYWLFSYRYNIRDNIIARQKVPSMAVLGNFDSGRASVSWYVYKMAYLGEASDHALLGRIKSLITGENRKTCLGCLLCENICDLKSPLWNPEYYSYPIACIV